MAYLPRPAQNLGNLHLLDRVILTGNSTEINFNGASGDGELQHVLDGDVSRTLYMTYRCVRGAAGAWVVELRPNGSSANLDFAHYGRAGGAASSGDTANMIFSGGTDLEEVSGDITIFPATGEFRAFLMQFTLRDSGGVDAFSRGGFLEESSTKITSLLWANAGPGTFGAGTEIRLYEIDESPLVVPVGAMEAIDEHVVETAVNTVTFSDAGGDGKRGWNVFGEEDEEYSIRIRGVVPDGTTRNYQLRPNGIDPGVTTDFETQTVAVDSGIVADDQFSDLRIFGDVAAASQFESWITISARTGFRRMYSARTVFMPSTLGPISYLHQGYWNDDTTDLTSLEFFTTSTGWGVGTTFEVFRTRARRSPEHVNDIDVSEVKTAAFTPRMGTIYRLDPSGGAFAPTLPAVGPQNRGKQVWFKNVTTSTNNITLTADGSDTIDGAATLVMNTSREIQKLQSNGDTEWIIVT